MDTLTDRIPIAHRSRDLKSQIANFEELVGNILSTGERAGDTNTVAMLDQLIALHAAIVQDNCEDITQLAAEGVDLNVRFDDNVNPQHTGITPLALACATNKSDVVLCLIHHGANVNTPFAALNTTALMTSSYHGHVDVVRILLASGADVQMVDLQKSTALGYSFGGSRNLDVVQQLLDHRIDVNMKNMLGMNALLLVAGYGNEMLVEKILHAGAEPNTVNDFGHTALHLTVVGKRDLLKKLRRLGTAEAVAADRSLNRRNLDVAIQEWARLHRDEVGGTPDDEHALAKAGSIMMSVGHQLEDHPGEDEDEQAILQKRVQAVWKHRQEKIQANKQKNKSGIWSLLSCGGGKSSKVDETNVPGAKPYTPSTQVQETPKAPQDEYSRLSRSFARILRLLIDAHCEIDRAEKTFGMTALDLAILNGDVESSAVLTSSGADPNHFLKMLSLKELYQAIQPVPGQTMGNRKEVKDLITYDEDLDVNQIFSRFNVDTQSSDEGMTPLTLAIRQDDIEIVKLLLKKGANVNIMGPSGRFPLAEASATGNIKLATLLLANNASLEKTCPAMKDATPLTIACNMQKHKLVEFFIKRGAKVDVPMSDGRIALLRAFESRDKEMVDILLRHSTQDNFTDLQGLTAHLAAEYQSKDRDTEAILAKVQDAVLVFQEEEEAIAAANTSANTSEENNQVPQVPPTQDHHLVQPLREGPAPSVTPIQQHYQQEPEKRHPVQERMEERRIPEQQQQPPAPLPAPTPQPEVMKPSPAPRQERSPTRPTQPAPPIPQQHVQEEVNTAEVITKTVTKTVTKTIDPVAEPVDYFIRGPPPPVPTSALPVEQQQEAEEPIVAPVPNESSSPKPIRKEESIDASTSGSEYTTDDDDEKDDNEKYDDEKDDTDDDDDEDDKEVERPPIIITSIENNPAETYLGSVDVLRSTTAPVATTEIVELEGETDIDDIWEEDASPTPHERSDVNENLVKTEEEMTTTTTTVMETSHHLGSPNANSDASPPPVPITSPPRESTETTV